MRFKLEQRVTHKKTGQSGEVVKRAPRKASGKTCYTILWDDESASHHWEAELEPEGQEALDI